MKKQNNSTFMTDAKWQRLNYRTLRHLAEDPEYAGFIVNYLDAHPEMRLDLSGIYFRAKDTVARLKA